MLPSGNDAAFALAEHFGALLKKDAHEQEEVIRKEEEERRREENLNKIKDDLGGHEGQDIPTTSTNHTANSSGSQAADPPENKDKDQHSQTKESFEKKDDEQLTEKGEKNYFTGTQIKKSQYVVKHSQARNHPEVMFFLEEMNKNADRLGLKYTFYDSPHGLSNKQNVSSALDVCKLSTVCMQNKKFREVVGTKFYNVKKNTNGNKRNYKWFNTHLMLG